MDTIKIIVALLLIAGSAFAGSYRVHYNVRRSGRDITVQAESSAEAHNDAIEDLIRSYDYEDTLPTFAEIYGLDLFYARLHWLGIERHYAPLP